MFVKALLVGFLFWQMCVYVHVVYACVFIGGAWPLPSIRMRPRNPPPPNPPPDWHPLPFDVITIPNFTNEQHNDTSRDY